MDSKNEFLKYYWENEHFDLENFFEKTAILVSPHQKFQRYDHFHIYDLGKISILGYFFEKIETMKWQFLW